MYDHGPATFVNMQAYLTTLSKYLPLVTKSLLKTLSMPFNVANVCGILCFVALKKFVVQETLQAGFIPFKGVVLEPPAWQF